MNEVQLIRRELAAQRRHARDVAASWSASPRIQNPMISNAYGDYFRLIIDLESRRVRTHLDGLGMRSDLSDVELGLLERCARQIEALAPERARDADLASELAALAQELETLAECRYRVQDWRRAAHVDADSILEERRLRAQALGEGHGPASG